MTSEPLPQNRSTGAPVSLPARFPVLQSRFDYAILNTHADPVRRTGSDCDLSSIQGDFYIPILMLSAKAEESDRVIGLNMGADDYLTKPFSRNELLARVQSLLRRYMTLGSIADQAREHVIRYFDLTLDKEQKKLFRLDQEIHLTATEYRIMELLLSRPGKVFAAEEIYERVWKNEAYAVENTVMIHISRIRNKLEINPNKPEYLKVVWGIGYKIEKK